MADVRLRDLNPAEFNYGVNVAGNLGVGTTSPAEKLHVNGGDIIVENNSSTTVDLRFRENGSDMLGLKYQAGTSANPLDIYNFNTSTTLLRVDENGKVGIGTSSPSDLLTVGGGTGSASITINKSDAGTAALEFEVGGTDKCYLRCNASEELILGTDDSDRVTIDTAGRVGIGITGPQNELHVAGSSTVLQLQSSTDTVKVQLNNSGSNACFYGSQNDNLFFQTNSTNRMFVTSAGNVGIGTTTPAATLELYKVNTGSSTNSTTLLSLHQHDNSDLSQQKSLISFKFTDANDNATPQVQIGAEVGENADANSQTKEGSGAFIVKTATGTGTTTASLTEKMRVSHDGKVGIGTSTPEETLHVNGNLKVTGTVDVGSSGFSVSSGFILPFGGGTAPSGWLECNGQAVSRSTYSDLFAIVGVTYGAGDGSTTFNVPDLAGRVIMGEGGNTVGRTPADLESIGDTGGSQTVTLVIDNLPSHTHETFDNAHGIRGLGPSSSLCGRQGDQRFTFEQNSRYSGRNCNYSRGTSRYSINAVVNNTGTRGSGTSHENIQPSIVIMYLIKT